MAILITSVPNSIAKIEGLTVSAICDLEIQKAKPYGEEFMVPCFTNYHEMLKTMPEIDIVAIITPSGMHFEHTLEVLKYYKKHVVIEKPTFTTVNPTVFIKKLPPLK